jgi:hypothetical protein
MEQETGMDELRGPHHVWRVLNQPDPFPESLEFRWHGGQGVSVYKQLVDYDTPGDPEVAQEIDYFTIGTSLWELLTLEEKLLEVERSIRSLLKERGLLWEDA